MSSFLPNTRSVYYLHKIPGDSFSHAIIRDFPKLYLNTWENEHSSFISAMKVEKVTYSFIGFIIVGIAGFTLMSMMSLSVLQKIPQIGILRAMGAKKYNIGTIFIIQALSLFFIEIDKEINIIKILFPRSVFFDFPLILQNEHILLIMMISFILLLSASIYPAMKAARLDSIQTIGFKR